MSVTRSSLDRLLRRLAQSDGVLAPLGKTDEGSFGVFVDGDRRRRPVMRADASQIDRLVSDGAVQSREDGSFHLTAAGQARVRRLQGDGAADFALQHGERGSRNIAVGEGQARAHVVNLAESPLAWLARRGGAQGGGFLAPREFAAGDKLRADYERSTLMGRVTVSWDAGPRAPGRSGGNPTACEHKLSATERVMAALAHVGPGLEQVVRAVCCEGSGLDGVEARLGWPRRSAKVVLKIGLGRLADYYQLGEDVAA